MTVTTTKSFFPISQNEVTMDNSRLIARFPSAKIHSANYRSGLLTPNCTFSTWHIWYVMIFHDTVFHDHLWIPSCSYLPFLPDIILPHLPAPGTAFQPPVRYHCTGLLPAIRVEKVTTTNSPRWDRWTCAGWTYPVPETYQSVHPFDLLWSPIGMNYRSWNLYILCFFAVHGSIR